MLCHLMPTNWRICHQQASNVLPYSNPRDSPEIRETRMHNLADFLMMAGHLWHLDPCLGQHGR